MRWLWRRRRSRATLTAVEMPYAQGQKVRRGRWEITAGQDPVKVTYSFWGSDAAAREHVEKQNAAFAPRRGMTRVTRVRRAVRRIHEQGRHTDGPVDQCPRCAPILKGV